MPAFSQTIIGAVFLWTHIGLSTADCNGLYFHFADGIRRPVFPLDVCAQAKANGVEFSYQYSCDSTKMDAIQYLYSSSNCTGEVQTKQTVTADFVDDATSVEVQCEEDECDYVIQRVYEDCDADSYYDDIYIVNECIEYDDDAHSEEWSCSEDGVIVTYYDGDGCFGSGPVIDTAAVFDSNGTNGTCAEVIYCNEWSMDCATESSALCANCAQYAPCISSIDPHCINQEALGCLDCKHYAECAVCAPGWDEGCIAMEMHANHSCNWPEMEVDNETISIPTRMDGECHYNSIWEQYMKSDCKTGDFSMDCNANCSICEESMSFNPSDAFDVQITDPMNAECFNYNETDEETNETDYKSMNVYGHCTHDAMSCPDGNSCGPESCSTNISSMYYDDYCIEIEVFGGNSTCNATDLGVAAGDYTAYAIADNVCRMDASGRSYYALECAEGVFYGVIGCLDCLCTDNCTDIVAANEGAKGLDGYAPNTCYQYNITDNLHIAGIVNETRLQCNAGRTNITIESSCDSTPAPSTDPTDVPTEEPTTTDSANMDVHLWFVVLAAIVCSLLIQV